MGSDSLDASLSQSFLNRTGEQSEYGYIQNRNLHAVVTNCKIESGIVAILLFALYRLLW